MSGIVEDILQNRNDSKIIAFTKDGRERLGADRVRRTVGRIARGLNDRFEGRGRIAIAGSPGANWAFTALGVLASRHVLVPLDNQLASNDIKAITNRLEPNALFAGMDVRDRIAFDPIRTSIFPLTSSRSPISSWLDRSGLSEGFGPERDDRRAVIFHTSGTTGKRKFVPLTFRNLGASIRSMIDRPFLRSDDQVLLPLPIHHVYPLVCGVLGTFGAGLDLVFPAEVDGSAIVRAINEGDVSIVLGVPRLYRLMVESIEDQADSMLKRGYFDWGQRLNKGLREIGGPNIGKAIFRPVHGEIGHSLRVLVSGGSTLSEDLVTSLEGFGWQTANGYGLTETSPLISVRGVDNPATDSVGRSVENVEIRLDQSKGGSEDDGEILVRGPNVFEGYLDEEKHEAVFTEEGWFRTGDLGQLDKDGNLFITGRTSSLIVLASGENVRPADLESFYERSDYIEQIGVLEDDGDLAAVVCPNLDVLRDSEETDYVSAIRSELARLGKERPTYERITHFELNDRELPTTRLGKIRRPHLKKRYQEVKEESEDQGIEEPISESMRKSLAEEGILDVFEWVEERFGEKVVRLDSNLQIDLGVDSLEWIRLTLEIERQFDVDLPDEAIDQIETVQDLLEAIDQRRGSEVTTNGTSNPLERPREHLDRQEKRRLTTRSWGEDLLARVVHGMNKTIVWAGYGPIVQNRPETIDSPWILYANHVSYLDPMIIAASLPYRFFKGTYFVGWTGITEANVFLRKLSHLARTVPIDTQRAPTHSLIRMAYVLNNGRNLICFPEGRRSPNGELQPFQGGLARLLKTYPDTTIVPLYIDGTYEAYPSDATIPRPRSITTVFGDFERASELANRPTSDVSDHLRARLANLRARV